MIRLSELQLKEVIIIDDGRRLGHISDLEIDPNTGKILAIIILAKEKKANLFGKMDELVINWNQIMRIGSDVILVKDVQEPHLYIE
jgi:YlmC/YmxH family sporulation protein